MRRLTNVALLAGSLAVGLMATSSMTSPASAQLASYIRTSVSNHPKISDTARSMAPRDLLSGSAIERSYASEMEMVAAGDVAAIVSDARQHLDDGNPRGSDWIIVLMDELARDATDSARAIVLDEARPVSGRFGFTADYFSAWFHVFDERPEAAIRAFVRAEEKLPNLAASLGRADLLEALDRNEEALKVYQELTPERIIAPDHDYDPAGLEFSIARMVIGRQIQLLNEMGRTDDAIDLAQRLAKADPDNRDHKELIKYIESGEAAEDIAKEAELTPRQKFAKAFATTANILNQQRMIATVMMNRQAEAYTTETALYTQLAVLVAPELSGLREDAVETLFQEGLFEGAAHLAMLSPEDDEMRAYFVLRAAQAMAQLGQDGTSRALVRQAMADDPRPEDQLNAGLTFWRLGDLEEAKEVLELAAPKLEEDRQKSFAYGMKSTVEQWGGDYQAALESARQAFIYDPSDRMELTLANAEVNAGNIDAGLAMYQRYLLRNPTDPDAMNALGYTIITETDELDRGYGILKRASVSASRDPAITDSLGWAYYLYGDLEEAERLVGLSLELFQPFGNWEVSHHMGDIQWHLGNKEEARGHWEDALKENPPKKHRDQLEAKLADGISTPPPAKRRPPDVKITDDDSVQSPI